MDHSFYFLKGWMAVEEFLGLDVPPIFKVLLTSDGSMTTHLKALFYKPVEVEVKEQRQGFINDEMAAYLETDEKEALERTVWLRVGRKKILYAHSTIPLKQISEDMLKDITRKPLGIFLGEQGYPVLRDRLMISLVESEEIANEFGFPPKEPLWARRYRLIAQGRLTAALFEVFSPGLLEALR